MSHSIICIVPNQAEADRIVEVLKTSGFKNESISAIVPDKGGVAEAAHKNQTKATATATVGAKTGLLVGGALGLLVGVGFLACPGFGIIAAGPIMAAISGAALGGSVGGVAGGLIGLGVHEDDAKHFEGKLREGNVLVSVHTENPDEATRAEEILKTNGGTDVKRSTKK